MDLDAILGRVLGRVERKAFVTPTDGIDDATERQVSGEVLRQVGAPGADVDALREQVRQLRSDGTITPRREAILLLSIAAHPAVADYAAMARSIADEEYAVLAEGGPHLASRRAVVLHHRAVLAFLMHRYEVALDLETRSVELAPWPDSLANILAVLLRLGEEGRARDLLAQMPNGFGNSMAQSVHDFIRNDPDLELLRDALPSPSEEAPCDTLLH